MATTSNTSDGSDQRLYRDAIARIQRCKDDYYKILQIDEVFEEQELKKQYRKLALLLHPDKNSEPGAAEAFKAVGNAYATLSDPQKRQKYDQCKNQPNGTSLYTQQQHHTRGYDSDLSAEEIFNLFFGGAFPTGTIFTTRSGGDSLFGGGRSHRRATYTTYRQNHNSQNHHNGDSNHSSVPPNILSQIMPLLVLISLAMFSYLSTPDPPFSLYRTDVYAHERLLQPYQIKYFVKDSFDRDYRAGTTALKRIESQVLDEYTQQMAQNCIRERNHRDLMIHRAYYFSSSSADTVDKRLEEAKQIKTPSCSRWDHINRLAREVRYGYA